MRGLLQKREYLKSRGERMGPAYLIFGTRCVSEVLFQEEIQLLVKNKILGKVYMCYSREPGHKKEYTSDKLRDDRVSKVLGPVLRKPATHVFICGSANMAEDSKASLACISSKETLEVMKAEGRMHEDVFGAVVSSSVEKNSQALNDDEPTESDSSFTSEES